MKVKDFERFVIDQAHMHIAEEAYSVIGLCGEAGEVAEWYKKKVLRSKSSTLTEEDLLNELGDVLHYVVRIAANHGWTLKQCMEANVTKLQKRLG